MKREHLSLAAVAASLVLAAAACGSSSKSTSSNSTASGSGSSSSAAAAGSTSCPGAPIKFGVITVLTGNAQITASPEVVYGAKAAAAALNKNCDLGGPVQIVSCDTKLDPNQAADCGREMVADHVISFIGIDEFGQNWFPITSAAGIPEIGGNGLDSVEVASPDWFPLEGNIHDALAQVTVAASAEPNNLKWADVDLDTPGVAFFDSFFKSHVEALGGQYVGTVQVPPTATDMTSYAQQVISDNANAIDPIISGDQENALIQALVQQGKPLTQVALIQELGFTCAQVKTLGSSLNGAWADDATWPVQWNTDNPGAKQYVAELAAAGLPHSSCDLSEDGASAWAAVHVLGMEMKGSTSMTPAALIQKLNNSGPINLSILPGPINYSHNAYPNDPVLSKLRIFSTDTFASRYLNGKVVVETPHGGVPLGQKFKPVSS